MDTQIIPDAATCPHCLADLFDPNNRRYHYPFTNCTHCGPRFTIIKAIPYDRKTRQWLLFHFVHNVKRIQRSSRSPFSCSTQCLFCLRPHIWLQDREQMLATHETALKQTALLLQQGNIVAVKGLGGFHLACDANNQKSVDLLRQRKHRPTKPLAIMVPDLQFYKI